MDLSDTGQPHGEQNLRASSIPAQRVISYDLFHCVQVLTLTDPEEFKENWSIHHTPGKAPSTENTATYCTGNCAFL